MRPSPHNEDLFSGVRSPIAHAGGGRPVLGVAAARPLDAFPLPPHLQKFRLEPDEFAELMNVKKCPVCGEIAAFGEGVSALRGIAGRWTCLEHRERQA